ncbi:hypothetical protein HMI54_008351 [Coelomomyces lativittatus]|nr:hypothetical protein HMI54_008351 [Coelomomyces lativittatus]
MQLVSMHNAEIKKLKQRHKNALKQCVRTQKARNTLRLKKWKDLINAEGEEEVNSSANSAHSGSNKGLGSANSSTSELPRGSPSPIDRSMSMESDAGLSIASSSPGSAAASMVQIVPDDVLEQREAELQIQRTLVEEQQEAEEKLVRIQESLRTLTMKQKEDMTALKKEQAEALKQLEESNQMELEELNLQQETEMRSLKKAHEVSIFELLATQQREHQMEASIRATERRTLTERKTLNSVLDNVTDGIITIDTNCIITRINSAVEHMFGYEPVELLNRNVKMIVPEPYQSNHDNFIQSYLQTRIPKLIGTGRNVEGLKKDGSTFPIYISVSEVREEEFHLFTAVLRDLTEEVAAEKAAKEEQEKKKIEMETLIQQLDVERTRSKKLIQSILPEAIAVQLLRGESIPPQTYNVATILFTDICGFTELSSSSDPLDIVDLLNDLYSVFDEIIGLYDVYKVETIGDSYMVVSGVPQTNGDKHMSEIAKLALHLLKAISTIKVRHRSDVVLKMRLGIHTGPVVAGVVGRKMPRYCLFGDTVAIASRMESAGLPMKIQVSDVTYEGLEKMGGFHFETRGEMHMQGKGNFKTYFLISKDGFDPVVEPKEKNPISSMTRKSIIPATMGMDDGMTGPERMQL